MDKQRLRGFYNFIDIALLIVLILCAYCHIVPTIIHAAEGDTSYQLLDTRLTVEDAEIKHVEQCGFQNVFLVKYPFGTEEIEVYNPDPSFITGRGDDWNTKELSKEDCHYRDGWWTIDFSSGYYDIVKFGGATQFKMLTGKDMDLYAQYYEVYFQGGLVLFIQIGDSKDPLDVLIKDYGNGEYNAPKELFFQTGRYGRLLETNQPIWYTLDGSDPQTSSTAQEYIDRTDQRPVIKQNTVVKARTKVTGENGEPIWGNLCTFDLYVRPSKPIISVPGGDYLDPVYVELMPPSEDCTIFYTMDGSDPDPEDEDNTWIYQWEPFEITEDTTLKAIAVEDEMSPSAIAEETYNFSKSIAFDLADGEKATWSGETTFATEHSVFLITAFGKESCDLIVRISDGAALSLNGTKLSANASGSYNVTLNSVKAEGLAEIQLEEAHAANTFTLTVGEENIDYTVYCVQAVCDGLPDEVYDYFCIGSQYTNHGIGTNIGTTLAGYTSNLDCVSMGNFGGYAIWKYDEGIEDDPNNPYGVDFIVYGNSFDGTTEAAEPGNILVSPDGEEWYPLAGSLHYDGNAVWDQEITYNKSDTIPGMTDYVLTGEDERKTLPSYEYPVQRCYPLHVALDYEWDFISFNTTGTFLHQESEKNKYSNTMPPYPAFGYADTGLCESNDNKAQNPYGGLVYNDPETEYGGRITTNRNGDACDIAWAVNPDGTPANLKKIRYIKVQTATCINHEGSIGEKSTEVCCIRKAKAAESPVDTTTEPSSIKIDGTEVDFEQGEVINANVSGIFDIVVDAPETTNVYINSLKSNTAFMDKAPHDIVRIIVQEGEKEPLIYYFKIKQSAQPSSKAVTKVTFDVGRGLMQDKTKLDCYYDADTLEHVGNEGIIKLPSATPITDDYGFYNWCDKTDSTRIFEEVNANNLRALNNLTLTAQYADAKDLKAANAVKEAIENLPDADELKLADADAVKAAQDAYDALKDDQKKLIGAEDKTKLALASATIGKLEAEERAETAEQTIIDLQTQLTQAQTDLTAAQGRVRELEGTVSTLQGQLKDAQDAAKDAQDKYDALKSESDADKKALKKAEDDLKAANELVEGLQTQLTTAQTDLATAQGKVTELQGKVNSLEKDLSDEKAKAEAAKGDADKYEEELAILKAQNAILKKTVKKVKAKAKKKSALVSWKSVGKGFKYEVYRSTNPTKSFKKVKTVKKLKVTVKKLKKGKTYYFKVRAFKKVGGKKVYTGYSNIAKIKIKK